MKARWMTMVVAIGAGVALGASEVRSQEVAGTWTLSVELDAGSGDARFVFEVEDNEISGTYTGTLGEQSVSGTVDGNRVTFSFTSDQVGEVTFEGTIEGDTMRGRCDYGMLGAGTFTGRRQ